MTTQHLPSTLHPKGQHPGLRMIRQSARLLAFIGSILAFALLIRPCSNLIDRIYERGTLRVAVLESSANSADLQIELASLFAENMGLELDTITVTGQRPLLELVRKGQVDLAIGLRAGSPGIHSVRTSLPYAESRPLLIGRKPATADQLERLRITLAANTAEAETAHLLSRERPTLRLTEQPLNDPVELLSQVAHGLFDAAMIDAADYEQVKALYPTLRPQLQFQRDSSLVWAFEHSRDQSLFNEAQLFLSQLHRDGTLASMNDFYSAGNTFDNIDPRLFSQHVSQRLPHYEKTFRQAAERTGLDWQLIAAVAYQESRWDPSAVSPTGVRGIMQLTQPTADTLGVQDRSNARQSIAGGASYLRTLINGLPASINGPDRLWFALAAYNAGLGHVLDARELAARNGSNPDRWIPVSQYLSLLKQPHYYRQTHYGFARNARQAVLYVKHIRRYYDVLTLNSSLDSRIAAYSSAGADRIML